MGATKAIWFACFVALASYVSVQAVEIEILDGRGPPAHKKHPYTECYKAFDGMTDGKEDCYLTGRNPDGTKAKAFFDIPEATIHKISVLNRPDVWYGQQENLMFSVCDSEIGESSCVECGKVVGCKQNDWTDVHCPSGGLQGDQIMASHDVTLEICELSVNGELVVDEEATTTEAVPTTTVDTTTQTTTELKTTTVDPADAVDANGNPIKVSGTKKKRKSRTRAEKKKRRQERRKRKQARRVKRNRAKRQRERKQRQRQTARDKKKNNKNNKKNNNKNKNKKN